MPIPLALDPQLAAIHSAEYPRFSDAEMARRRTALHAVMEQAGVDHLLMCGEQRAGTGVGWLTSWPTTVEAYVLVAPREPQVMYMEWYNHWPLARKLARDTEVLWGEHRGFDKVLDDLKRRGAKRVGVMGALGYARCRKLEAAFGPLADLNREYVRLRLVKSPEEIRWMRIAAALTDLAIEALRRDARPGMTERELGAICESAYHPHGGVTYIHYFLATPMAAPEYCVPRQIESSRKLLPGDVVATEITAQFFEYPGQILRSFTVASDPTPLFRRLYDTAEAAFDAVTKVIRHGTTMRQIVDAAGVIEDAGFTVYDDLMHGFGGGYFPPVLGSKSRPAGPLPEMTLEAGMTCVVQPNVITPDQKAGVQVGELVLVTKDGFERMHRVERGLFRIG
ncbi:MAG TPA: M24 family metallopeptidase [Burkholderiales bacterium]|nr:M24 family metallopeptidase [Burkholderiales bacterium]